ncbi:MAG: TonB-dependent receptor [Gemmatimonadetes bacterium]|jgi:iron complex outermembrane recepter protein|nr:TonB-dependent receptor [Gemmatimonadota bacterium]MBT6145053.1 TonB-dependent receptor [Gemmatimonadota bacterium]MBT7862717.1 TonB-dependent receptor [Gemmatimonadota bacterium]
MAAWIVATGMAGAAQTPTPPLYVVDTLTVQALRTPATLGSVPYSVNSVPVSQILAHTPGLSLSEALTGIPGIQVVERHNLSQGDRIAIRGIGARASFGVRGLRILIDGIPLTMADGQSQPGVVDLSQLESIDVVRGPAAALYGNAAGGVLHLRSRPVTEDAFRIDALTGSDGLRQARFRADIVQGENRFHLAGSHTDADGFREHAFSRQRTLQAGWQRQLAGHWQWAVTGHLYNAPWLYNPSSLDRAGADSNPEGVRFFVRQQGAAKQVRHAQIGTSLNWAPSNDTGLEIASHVIGRSLANPIPGRIIDLERSAFGLRVVGHHRWRPTWDVVAGVEIEGQQDHREEFGNDGLEGTDVDRFRDDTIFERLLTGERQIDQEETATGIGLFALTRWQLRPFWTLSAGARLDRHHFDVTIDDDLARADLTDQSLADESDDGGDRNLIQLSPTLGLTYTPSQRLTLYANLATAYLTPTTVELGNRADGRGGFNPDLDPEHYDSMEAGCRFVWPRARIDGELAVYQLDLEDMLVPFGMADSDEIFYRNAAAARNRGTELRLRWTPRARLRIDASLHVTDFVFTDHSVMSGGQAVSVDGNEVPAVPPWSTTLISQWQPTDRSQIRVSLRHQGRMMANDLNGPAPGSDSILADYVEEAHTVIDLRASIQRYLDTWDVDLFLGINNLFDATYNGSVVPNAFGDRFFEPAPGRTVFTGIRLQR